MNNYVEMLKYAIEIIAKQEKEISNLKAFRQNDKNMYEDLLKDDEKWNPILGVACPNCNGMHKIRHSPWGENFCGNCNHSWMGAA